MSRISTQWIALLCVFGASNMLANAQAPKVFKPLWLQGFGSYHQGQIGAEAFVNDSATNMTCGGFNYRLNDYRLLDVPMFRDQPHVSKNGQFRAWTAFTNNMSTVQIGIDNLTDLSTPFVYDFPYDGVSTQLGVATNSTRGLIAFGMGQAAAGFVTVLDTNGSFQKAKLSLPNDMPAWLDFSPDDTMLAVVTVKGAVNFYRTSDWKLVKTLNFPVNSGVPAVAFSRDWSHFVASTNVTTRVLNVQTGAVEGDFSLSSNSVDISQDGTKVVLAGQQARLVDVPSKKVSTLPTINPIISVGMSPDARTIALFDNNGCVAQYNGVDGNLKSSVPDWLPHIHQSKLSDDCQSVYFVANTCLTKVDSHTGTYLASSNYDTMNRIRVSKFNNQIVTWDTDHGSLRIMTFDGSTTHNSDVTITTEPQCLDADISSSGGIVAYTKATNGGTVQIWKQNSTSAAWKLTNVGASPTVSINPDSKSVLVRSKSGLGLYDINTGIQIRRYFVPSIALSGWVEYSRSGNSFAFSFGPQGSKLLVFDSTTGIAKLNLADFGRPNGMSSDVFIDEANNRVYRNEVGGNISMYNYGAKQRFNALQFANDYIDMRPDVGLFAFNVSDPNGTAYAYTGAFTLLP